MEDKLIPVGWPGCTEEGDCINCNSTPIPEPDKCYGCKQLEKRIAQLEDKVSKQTDIIFKSLNASLIYKTGS